MAKTFIRISGKKNPAIFRNFSEKERDFLIACLCGIGVKL